MGVEDYLLASTLNGVLAQRLVRRLCESCKTCTPILPELLHQLDGEVLTESWRASGCNACNGRGSSGRIAVSELLMIDDVLREAMLGQPTSTAVHSVALKNGMKPIHTAGLDLVREGTCSLEDVLRVTIMGSQ
jgi:general secretion pathway protein E